MPATNIFGENALNNAIEMIADSHFKRVLIVTDPVMVKTGLVAIVEKELHKKNLFCA
ncbi:iron-containing alcohol dehydrogenase, partial [Salmonella enterica subsp. enterica]|nr:iron-containing alcohol dehydrogenase [Salmonella enterica subsp. enterica]